MRGVNKVILVGTLGRDPETETYQIKYWLIFFFNFFLKLKQIIHRTVKVLTQLIGDW